MSQDRRLSKIDAEIYEAALDWERWPVTLDRLCAYLGACSGYVAAPFWGQRAQPIWSSIAEAALVEAHGALFPLKDPVAAALERRLPAEQAIFVGEEILAKEDSPREGAGNDDWHDFLKRFGIGYSLAMTIDNPDGRAAILVLFFPRAQPGLGVQRELLATFAEPLARALRIGRHLAQSRQEIDAARATLDGVDCGVMWLGGDGEIIYANRRMHRLFVLDDGLALIGGKFSIDPRAEGAALSKALAALRQGEMRIVDVARPSGKPPFRLTISAIPGDLRAHRLQQAIVIAFVVESHAEPEQAAILLAQRFRLTAAETRVASRLIAGKRVKEIAKETGLSSHTIRTQIKSILTKSEVNRQADLIRLAASMAPLA